MGRGFSVLWNVDRGSPGVRMIPYRDRAGVDGCIGGAGVGCPLIRTLGDRRRGWGGFIFNINNNK